jgi:hypothetical protein
LDESSPTGKSKKEKQKKSNDQKTGSSKGKATTCEDTILEDSISKGICQQHLTNSMTNYQLPLTERRLLENMTKDPISEFFLNKKNPDICSRVAGYISSYEIFCFSNNKNSKPSKKRTSLKRLLQDRTTSRLHFERTQTKLDSPGKAGETRRSSSSTMKYLGACRRGALGVPRKEGRSSLTRIPPM